MTVLLVMFLFLAFVGTDQIVRLAIRRARARRHQPSVVLPTSNVAMAKRAVG
jgi:hypothetical protein